MSAGWGYRYPVCRLWNQLFRCHVSYASENEVATLVSGLVKDITKAMGLVGLKTFTEIGPFGLRPDVWVVTWNMIPVGVIQVKKPEEDKIIVDSGKSVLDEPTALAELYDFQMKLPNFYGLSPAFGSTIETVWLNRVNSLAQPLDSMMRLFILSYLT